MTREEYEEKQRRLVVERTNAKQALDRAQAVYDRACERLRDVDAKWSEQQTGAPSA